MDVFVIETFRSIHSVLCERKSDEMFLFNYLNLNALRVVNSEEFSRNMKFFTLSKYNFVRMQVKTGTQNSNKK
jgi:hypothetical protein